MSHTSFIFKCLFQFRKFVQNILYPKSNIYPYFLCSPVLLDTNTISTNTWDNLSLCLVVTHYLLLLSATTQLHYLTQLCIWNLLPDAITQQPHHLLFFQSLTMSVAISCGDPGVPPNAAVSGTHSWTFGSVLQYSCLPGGVLVGNSTRHCQEEGTWSGAPPYCTGKNNLLDEALGLKNIVFLWKAIRYFIVYSCTI